MVDSPTGPGATDRWSGLMAAAQDGDAAAYATLLREVTPFIRAVIARRHAAPDRIEDVVQDALLTVHRVRHTYDPARPFTRWLAAIAERRSIDALRARFRRDAVEAFSPLAYETFPDPEANKEIVAGEDSAVLAEAISRLPTRQRQAVELLRLKEMSVAEAARASGQSEGALKTNLHRAIRALQKRFGAGQ